MLLGVRYMPRFGTAKKFIQLGLGQVQNNESHGLSKCPVSSTQQLRVEAFWATRHLLWARSMIAFTSVFCAGVMPDTTLTAVSCVFFASTNSI